MSQDTSQTAATGFPGVPAADRDGYAHHPAAFTLFALAATLAVWIAVSNKFAERLADNRIVDAIAEEETRVAEQAEAISFNVGHTLGQLHGIPVALADSTSVIAALATFGPASRPSKLPKAQAAAVWTGRADLATLNRHLALVNAELGANVIYVMNASGDCVASSNHDRPESFVGANFGQREYFRTAAAGRRGRQFALGSVSNVPGLYFSAPVRSARGQLIGVVAVKIDIHKLSHWIDRADAFLTDENDVVILARDKRLEMRALAGGRVFDLPPEFRHRRYRRDDFKPLPIAPAGQDKFPSLMHVDGADRPFVIASRQRPADAITVHVLGDLDAIAGIRGDARWAFSLLAAAGSMLVLLAAGVYAYIARNRGNRILIEQANTSLRELNALLTLQATTDALTGCANRRRFIELLAVEVTRGARYGHPVSVIAVDLDHFKRINDTFGHTAGDEALRHFTRIAERILRTPDVLGRLGGEEFAILAPETDEAGATMIAERLRKNVEDEPARFGDKAVSLTISVGVAAIIPTAGLPELLLVQQADEALYAAKRAGRNQVIRHSALPPTAVQAAS